MFFSGETPSEARYISARAPLLDGLVLLDVVRRDVRLGASQCRVDIAASTEAATHVLKIRRSLRRTTRGGTSFTRFSR